MPGTDNYSQNITYPKLGDAPNIESPLASLVNGITPQTIMRFPSASARSARLTSPVAGMVSWLAAEGRFEFYTGSAWITYPIGSFVPASTVVRGTVNVSFTSLGSYTQSITFGTPFSTVPVVMTNIASAAGPTARWGSRAYNVTATGFTLFLFSGDATNATWPSQPIEWLAVAV